MKPQDCFNSDYFTDIIENVILEDYGRVRLITKTETEITEGEDTNGSYEDSEENHNAD